MALIEVGVVISAFLVMDGLLLLVVIAFVVLLLLEVVVVVVSGITAGKEVIGDPSPSFTVRRELEAGEFS